MTKASIVLSSSEAVGACPPSLGEARVASSLRRRLSIALGKYLQLAKPGIVMGNLVSVVGGFLLASKGHINVLLLLITAAGVSLVIGSGCAFNNYIDRDIDLKMRRTQKRVLVQGGVSAGFALAYASVLGIAGTFLLAHFVNILSAALVFIGFTIYVGVYSLYMKRHSVFGTFIGSFSGAMPPVIGYCAVSGQFDLGAILLLATFSLWQMPHSYAIAILHLRDYAAADIPVLPVKNGVAMAKRHILFYIVAFTAAALMLGAFGYTGRVYLVITAALGIYWFAMAVAGYKATDERAWARKMFVFSIVCITALSVVMALDYATPRDVAGMALIHHINP